MAALSAASCHYIVNHVCLPPKLPHSAEPPQLIRDGESCLVQLLLTQAQNYQQDILSWNQESYQSWQIIGKMLDRLGTLISLPSLSVERLIRDFCDFQPSDVLLIQLDAQNAALVLRKESYHVIFECFELSPDSASVMAAQGSLVRHFPAHAISIPLTVFDDPKFQKELAMRLCQLDVEVIEEMMPESIKADKSTAEIRDTVHPGLVTEMLMATLAPLGIPITVCQISKRTRDDVLWKDCLIPWRRSPLWLAIRVAIQSTLAATLPCDQATIQYKDFMIFFLAHIGSMALSVDLSDELCHIISIKIARRTWKLGEDISKAVQDKVLITCNAIRAKLESKWQTVQLQDADRLTTVEKRPFAQDTAITLPRSEQYLQAALDRGKVRFEDQDVLDPHCESWLRWRNGLPSLSNLPGLSSQEAKVQALGEFEGWVSHSLPEWTEQRLASAFSDEYRTQACRTIADVAIEYRNITSSAYADSSEQLSTMLLTIAELWHALDLLTIESIPLLADFSAGIEAGLFDPLLLPKKGQMTRLRKVEQHLSTRQSKARVSNYPSIFSDPRPQSFAVQYFESSSHHQALRRLIEHDAEKAQEEKKVEWKDSMKKYRRLKDEAKATPYRFKNDEHSKDVHDDAKCKKCPLDHQADAMRIQVHEWPLPSSDVDCKSAVFELACPREYSAWRNLTWMLLQDLSREGQWKTVYPLAHLSTYTALREYHTDNGSWLTLSSGTKPFAKTHYSQLSFPVATVDSCFAQNALQYKLFDNERSIWVSAQAITIPSLHHICVTKLPAGPYENLQYAVDSVKHSQNQVIADQDSCSKDLSLHEFVSFGSVRSDGERTQWYNMRRELSACNLSFNTKAVQVLMLQAAWQAGSQANTLHRNSHADLACPEFCKELLTVIVEVLDSIRANWKSDNTMLIVISLVLRVLSLCTTPEVSDTAVMVLRDARAATHSWTEALGNLLQEATDPQEISRLQQRLLKISILCKMTYDVDDDYVVGAAYSIDDTRIWITCSMRVRENTPGSLDTLPYDLRRLVIRDQKLTIYLSERFRRLIVEEQNTGIDEAILRSWSGYRRGVDSWLTLSPPNARWLRVQTPATEKCRSQIVHYNLFNGELLVSGKPLGRLPMEYVQSDIYLRVFGAQILQVSSADMPDMLYMSTQNVHGHAVYFGMSGQEVVIKAVKDSHTMQAVPKDTFEGDLPQAFIEDHIHWLDLSNGAVEFRPKSNRWESRSDNWRLQYVPGGTSEMSDGNRKLIDMRSATCAAVLGVFKALDSLECLLVTLSSSDRFEVSLPRYDLRFFLNNEGLLECYELCKIVDPSQRIGTMIGLQNRLVLCGVQPLARKHDRILLVPEGQISVYRTESHVNVHVNISGSKVRLFRYQIDAILQRLQEDGDIICTLYKVYLHALTSHVLPDPFLEQSGTEEALCYLRQRSLSFTKPPGPEATALLESISALTPSRQFYPDHKRVMESVNWDSNLSMLVQHDKFLPLAEAILGSGDPYTIFYPDLQRSDSLYKDSDQHLLSRAEFRNSSYRSADFGVRSKSPKLDHNYAGRDATVELTQAQRSFEMSKLAKDWSPRLDVSRALVDDIWTAYPEGLEKLGGARFDETQPLSDLLSVHLSSSWGPLLELCRVCTQVEDTYRLVFLFGTLAYGGHFSSLTLLRTLLAFAINPELRNIPRMASRYTKIIPSDGTIFDQIALRNIISGQMSHYNGPGKRHKSAHREAMAEYEKECKKQTEAVVTQYVWQWPTHSPYEPQRSLAPKVYWDFAHRQVKQLFFSWTANGEYQQYLKDVQVILDNIYQQSNTLRYEPDDWHQSERRPVYQLNGTVPPAWSSVLNKDCPQVSSGREKLVMARKRQGVQVNRKLRALINDLRCGEYSSNGIAIRSEYRDDLVASYDSFESHSEPVNPPGLPCRLSDVVLYRIECEHHMRAVLENIRSHITSSHGPITEALECTGLWPRMTIRALLSLLSSTSAKQLGHTWQACLLRLGEAVSNLQRARRLVLAAGRRDILALSIELENSGRSGWSTELRPDWLLIEIENDFLIRPTQAKVALEMIQPSSAANSLIQLNMGEGKSSVIVPLVAVAVADGTRLSRILVLKSLTQQMQDTLTCRLGGIVDRRILFMPFSRKIKVSDAVATQIQIMLEQCVKDSGILLAQPEHILSFKLMGIERLTSGNVDLAGRLLHTQRWLDLVLRDVLDESDEVLDVKFQLIYTLGAQRLMDGQPYRWLITQGLFDLVDRHIRTLDKDYPIDIEWKYRTSSSFPHLRLLSVEVSRALMQRVAYDIINSKIPSLNFEECTESTHEAVLSFILDRDVSAEKCSVVQKMFAARETFMQNLLLVRGLIAFKILIFVLGKRWSVDYGLHPSRCLSAVPYRAKGVPALSAEFGHPDVAVALTCLSYYYTGLTDAQVRQVFELLGRADDPSLEYASWVRDCRELPDELRSWNAINLEDDRLCHEELFPRLRYGKKIVDFFLAQVVFPKEGKEFDEKLSASGWDIVSGSKCHITTGFSGTNDNRFVLPLQIRQQDLPELKHTSGKVLDCVLREENLTYYCAQDTRGRQLSARGLIESFTMFDPSIRVLIDVGAQVLGISNREFVKAWVQSVPSVDAGIFFDEYDNVMVLGRDSRVEKLSTSSFQSRMDRCVVYLDEVHTRGTDLKLPADVRAAVTLGPRLTKDRLVQACMRLRGLGQGQTLMYLAPPEIHKQITELSTNGADDLNGYDVVAWALEQSCQNIERSQPLRILQGLGHCKRQNVMDTFVHSHPHMDRLASVDPSSNIIKNFREKEEQRLTDLYSPMYLKNPVDPMLCQPQSKGTSPMEEALLELWRAQDHTLIQGASMQEEHEREVAHEVEKETQVERPPKSTPVAPSVDPHLRQFIKAGAMDKLLRFPSAYDGVVWKTSKKIQSATNLWTHLRMTRDFRETIERPLFGYADNYLRPANWVLTSKQEDQATFLLLISQFEANSLLPDIRSPTSGVRLHVYEPRVTRSMTSVDFRTSSPPLPSTEKWQCLTSSLRRELNLFAGQLYFNTHKDYKDLCVDIGPRFNTKVDETLGFVRGWIGIRRKGQDFTRTHVGWMIDRRAIGEELFEEPSLSVKEEE